MKLNTLKPARGSVRNNTRKGRGTGSGKGGTSTRGHKGAQSRSGYKTKPGSEGGQMPLQRRLPKFGFNRPQKIILKPVNLDAIQSLSELKKTNVIDLALMIDNGIVGRKDVVKILGRGELKSKVDVSAHYFSEKAAKAISEAGGKVTRIEV
jgi:large subunit ribosomal protein L15